MSVWLDREKGSWMQSIWVSSKNLPVADTLTAEGDLEVHFNNEKIVNVNLQYNCVLYLIHDILVYI